MSMPTQIEIDWKRVREDMRVAVDRMIRSIETTLAAMRARQTPEQAERVAEVRYRRRIAAERAAGLSYVRSQARKSHPLTESWFRHPDK